MTISQTLTKLRLCGVIFAFIAVVNVVHAEPEVEDLPSEDDFIQAFEQAQKNFSTTTPPIVIAPKGVSVTATTKPQVQLRQVQQSDIAIVPSDVTMKMASGYIEEAPLRGLRMVIDMENVTLKQAVNRIIKQAEEKSGPWQVKWRVAQENKHILEEKVNLTAESTFAEFLEFLVDRVNNMSGVHLFVSIFEASRVIIISDTYY